MKRIFFVLCSIIFMTTSVQAFEDCVLSSDVPITNIEIEDSDIIEIHSIYTLMNEKNMFLLQPLKIGKTKFSFIHGDDDKITLGVEVKAGETIVDSVPQLEVLTLDVLGQNKKQEIDDDVLDLDEPPVKVGDI